MIVKSITLLPMSTLNKIQGNICAVFSKKIIEKTALYRPKSVMISLLFAQKKHPREYFIHKSKKNFSYIINKQYLDIKRTAEVKTKQINNFSYKQEVDFKNKISQTIKNTENKYLIHNDTFKKYTVLASSQNQINTTDNRKNLLFFNKIIKKNIDDNMQQNEKKVFKFTQYKEPHSYNYSRIENETFVEKNILNKVENFIYKSENNIEVRVQEIEKNITNLTKITHENKATNISKEIKHNKNSLQHRSLEEMSEKVYALVMKKWVNEQKRKGNLYA